MKAILTSEEAVIAELGNFLLVSPSGVTHSADMKINTSCFQH